MSNPQQPEIARSRKTPSQDAGSAAALIEGRQLPADEGVRGPVPPGSQPGHHPATEQDKPDLNAFAERIGTRGAGAGVPGAAALRRLRGRAPSRRTAAAVLCAVLVLLLGRVVRRRLAPA